MSDFCQMPSDTDSCLPHPACMDVEAAYSTGFLEFPAGNQNSATLPHHGTINSLVVPYDHAARVACVSDQLAVGRQVLGCGDMEEFKTELRSGRLPYFVRSTCHE